MGPTNEKDVVKPLRTEVLGLLIDVTRVEGVGDQSEDSEAALQAQKILAEAARLSEMERLNRELKRTQDDMKEVETLRHTPGLPKQEYLAAIQSVNQTVARALAQVTEGKVEPPPHSKALFVKLADNPSGKVDAAAPQIHQLLMRYLDKDITFSSPGQPQTSFERDLELIKASNPIAGQIIDKAVDDLRLEGRFPQLIQERRVINQARPFYEDDDREQWRLDFNRDYKQFLTSSPSSEDMKVFKAMYEVKYLAELYRDVRTEVAALGYTGADLDREASHALEEKIVLLFSKLFTRVDEEQARLFFDEITKEGLFSSIDVVFTKLKAQFSTLIHTIEATPENELPEEFRHLFFQRYAYTKTEDRVMTYRDKDGVERTRNVPRYRITPLPGEKEVELPHFLAGIGTEIVHEVETRRYLHNVRALFLRGPGEKGFWPQLAHYAEQEMQTTDMDGIPFLPDSDVVWSAFRLYSKYVEEALVNNNWFHNADMFLPDRQSNYTKIEQNVFTDLINEYPDMRRKDEWRLRRAMTMAVGMSRGVWLTEPETASSADPVLNQEKGGSATYYSYYTNDNVALNALNPMHHFWRWQSEQATKGPLVFMPLNALDPMTSRAWDHKVLFQRMTQYRESYLRGAGVLTRSDPNERLFIELLPNIANVGSPISRGGWREEPAYEGWLQSSYLDSWKALENIGYEVLLHYVDNKIYTDRDFLIPSDNDQAAIARREDFFRYLFRKYISTVPIQSDAEADAGLAREKERLRPIVERTINDQIKKGRVRKEDREEYLKLELQRRLLYEALYGVLRERIPTKLIRFERDRMAEGGKRVWERVREEIDWASDRNIYDRTLTHLMRVETILRKETTEIMREHLKGKHPEDYDLQNAPVTDYKVTEASVRRILGSLGVGEDEIRKAIQVLGVMKRVALDDDGFMDSFVEKINTKDPGGIVTDKGVARERYFPFAIGMEELEPAFLTFRGAGGTMLKRAIGDTGMAETVVFEGIKKYINLLGETATNGKKSYEELVGEIFKIKEAVEGSISKEWGQKLAYNLATMTIAYFRRDAAANNLLTGAFRIGERNSLAAEFAKYGGAVWEWDVPEIDSFITALETKNILPAEPYLLSKDPSDPKNYTENEVKIFGKKLFGYKVRKPDYDFYGGKLRDQVGANNKDKLLQVITKWIPIFLLIAFILAIKKALDEGKGK